MSMYYSRIYTCSLLSGASLIARERAYTDKITLRKMTLRRQWGPLNALVSQYAQFVLDALRYVQPVRTVCTGCAEVCAALVSQYAQFVLDALRYVQHW